MGRGSAPMKYCSGQGGTASTARIMRTPLACFQGCANSSPSFLPITVLLAGGELMGGLGFPLLSRKISSIQ